MTEAVKASHNVVRFLDQRVAEQPEVLALRIPRGKGRFNDFDFRSLGEICQRYATGFRRAGIKAGHRTLLIPRPGLDLIGSVFALFQIGAVPVVLDPGMGMGNLLRAVRHTRPEAVVGVPIGVGLSRLFRGSFASVRVRATLRPSLLWEWDRVTAIAREQNDPAAILFTSGSTGPAKGVCYTHGMFDAQVRAVGETFAITPGEVDFPMLPVFALFNPALGMTTVLPPMNPSRPARANPGAQVEAMVAAGVTNSFGSPVLWGRIGEWCQRRGVSLPSLRRILMAGAPAPPPVLRAMAAVAPQATIHTPYGATECLPVTSITAAEILGETWSHTIRGGGTCVGRPIKGMEVRVMRPVRGPVGDWGAIEWCPVGEIGEVVVTGPTVTREYDRLPGATAEAKLYEGRRVWHRMGDMGTLDGEGRLWFCGRKAERVDLGSGDVRYTDCVEAPFLSIEGVQRVALIGLPEEGKTVPALVVEPKRGSWPRGSKARRKLASELMEVAGAHPASRDLRRFFLCRHFPVDVRHNAKIHRLTLARRAAEGRLKSLRLS